MVFMVRWMLAMGAFGNFYCATLLFVCRRLFINLAAKTVCYENDNSAFSNVYAGFRRQCPTAGSY
jgi:hypothetical protein